MKKLLGTLLAAAMVFSTMAFAAPITEPVETVDEISSISEEKDTLKRNNDVSLMEDSAGYYDPSLGIRLFSEDFQSKEVGENVFDPTNPTKVTLIGKFRLSTDNPKALNAEFAEVDGNKVFKMKSTGLNTFPNITINKYEKNFPSEEGQYTFKARFKLENDDSAASFKRVEPRLNGKAFTPVKNTLSAGEWADTEYSYTASVTSNMMIIFFADVGKTPTVYMDDMALYYKPTASDTYDVSVDFPTVTVTAANGFDANAVEAITAEPAKYISGSVESVAFTGTTMTITLKSADEFTIPSIVNNAGTATYPETKVSFPDYNTLLYGLKNYYWSASSKSVEGTDVAGNTEISSYEFKNDKTVGDYLEITYNADKARNGVQFKRDSQKPYGKDEPYTYTYLTKIYLDTAKSSIRGTLVTHDWKPSTYYKDLQCSKWLDYVIKDYVIEERAIGNNNRIPSPTAPYIYFHSGCTLRVAYAGLYYKPVKVAAAPAVTSAGNTVTVTYSEGIDENMREALSAYYTKYFDEKVAALTVTGNDVAVTLADGVESVTMPALVNKDGSATYKAVTVYAKPYLSPVTLNEKELRLTNTNSGLRFKAYVLHENLESLDEYGYIVALEKTLTDNRKTHEDLTFDLDKNTVKYVSEAAYVSGRDKNYIFNNNYEVNGSTANLFTGVLTGIPKGKYDLTLVARPYAKSEGGTYYYGEPISGNVRELALEIKNGGGYNALTDAQKAIIDTFAENKAE